MTSRIMLVIGDCDQQAYTIIESAVKEKLNKADSTGISFKYANRLQDSVSINLAINELLAGVDPDANLDKRYVNVVVILDGATNSIENIKKILTDLEAVKPTTGIWQFSFHLIWMIEEVPFLKYTYSELLEQLTNGETKFSNIYILSDRNSDQGHGKDIRNNAASMLISTLQHSEPQSSGLYSIGIGKMLISAHEMQEYARHQAVNALKNQSFRWNGFMKAEDLCAAAFDESIQGESDFLEWIDKTVSTQINTTFAFAKGETTSSSSVGEHTVFDFKDILAGWEEFMLAYIKKVPFTERIVEFYAENGGFRDFCERVETAFVSKPVREVKPGFLAMPEQKEVIKNYNVFMAGVQNERRRGLTQFIRDWPIYALRVHDAAQKQLKERNHFLESFIRDEQFIQQCEAIAPDRTKSIVEALAGLEISAERFMSFTQEDDFSPNKASVMLDWIAENTCKAASMEDLMSSLANQDVGMVISQVLNPVISKARNRYLACPTNMKFGDPAAVYLFMPEKLFNEELQKHVDYKIIPVNNVEYQNVEALAMVRVNTNGDIIQGSKLLTAFNGFAIVAPEQKDSEPENKHSDTIFVRSETAKPKEAHETGEPDNPWKIEVRPGNNGFNIMMVWPDGIEQVTLRVDGEDGRSGTKTIKRQDFQQKGSANINELVDYGLHTASLISAGRTLSKTQFIGKRHQIELEAETADFQLDKDILLQKITLRVSSVDGVEKAQLISSVADGICLLLDRKDLLDLPQPWLKHKQQGWTIIMEDKLYEPVMSEQFSNEYQLHMV